MNFDDIVVNENLKYNLNKAVDGGRFSHAVILEGGNAEQRTKLSAQIARALICTADGERPCGVCKDCVKMHAMSHPDVIEIVGGEAAKSFHIDKIREVRRDVYVVPNEASRKIYILTNAQSMTVEAQNALLKILEEPPEYACFILTCTSRNTLLPTVLSRCTVYSIGFDGKDDVVEDDRLFEAKRVAGELAFAIMMPNEYDLLEKTAVFEKDKELLGICLPELKLIFRDAVIIRNGGKPISCSPEAARQLSQKLTCERLIALIENVSQISDSIKKNANHNLLITRLSAKLKS